MIRQKQSLCLGPLQTINFSKNNLDCPPPLFLFSFAFFNITLAELNSRFQAYTEEIDLGIVEDSIFGKKRTSVVLYVARMRAILDHVMNRLPSSRFINHDGYRRENERGIRIGNYTYYAGGHWVPLDCEPKWKVKNTVACKVRIPLSCFFHDLFFIEFISSHNFIAQSL